ncbi:MAG TPA: hypothetical protein VFD03_10570 [Clostridia bacterium]|nr:hypothetical protein [Clostridia bacterium]
MTKQRYLVTAVYQVKTNIGIFEAESDDDAIKNANEDVIDIYDALEDLIGFEGEVVVDNYYTEVV